MAKCVRNCTLYWGYGDYWDMGNFLKESTVSCLWSKTTLWLDQSLFSLHFLEFQSWGLQNFGANFYVSTQFRSGVPQIWLQIILGVSMKVFLDEINISINRLNKTDYPAPCEWVLSKAWIEGKKKKGNRGFVFPTRFQGGTLFSPALGLEHTPTVFLALRLADSKLELQHRLS